MMKPCLQSWQNFWNEEGNGWHLSVIRIIWSALHIEFAIVMLRWAIIEHPLPTLPYPFFSYLSVLPLEGVFVLSFFQVVFALLLLFGWKTRIMQVLIALTAFFLFFRSASTYQNHYGLYLFMTFYLTLASTEKYYSMDAREKRRKLGAKGFDAWQNEPVSLLAHRLLLLQGACLYFFAGISKFDPEWFARWTTTPELLHLTHGRLVNPLWEFLLENNIAWIPLTATALFMIFLSVGIFFGRYHPYLILLPAALMHLAFDQNFPIMQFTPLLLTVLFLALFPADGNMLGARMRKLFLEEPGHHGSTTRT